MMMVPIVVMSVIVVMTLVITIVMRYNSIRQSRRVTRQVFLQDVGIGWFNALVIVFLSFMNFKSEFFVKVDRTSIIDLNMSGKNKYTHYINYNKFAQ